MAARIIEYKGRRKTEEDPKSTESRVDKWERPEDRRPKAEEAPDNRGSGMHLENRIHTSSLNQPTKEMVQTNDEKNQKSFSL